MIVIILLNYYLYIYYIIVLETFFFYFFVCYNINGLRYCKLNFSKCFWNMFNCSTSITS